MKKIVITAIMSLFFAGFINFFLIELACADWVSPGTGIEYTMEDLDVATTDVTWHSTGEYYVITGNITISQNDKLIIEPCITIKFDTVLYCIKLIINGALDARGTKEQLIILTNIDTSGVCWIDYTPWGGILLDSSCVDTECIIKYCKVEYTAPSCIWVKGSSPLITHTILRKNARVYYSESGMAIYCSDGSFPRIENCLFYNLDGPAIWCDTTSNPYIKDNDIITSPYQSVSIPPDEGYSTYGVVYGGFLEGNYLECEEVIDTTLGEPIDTIGDGMCNTTSICSIPQFLDVDGIKNPSSNPGGIEEVNNNLAVKELLLYQNFPNPFTSVTYIQYLIPRYEYGSLRIYDICGRLVKTLADDQMSEGSYLVSWDGKNQAGEKLSDGMYFYKLIIGSKVLIKKMVLIH